MQLFFHSEISEGDREVVFSRDESRHIIKVLRKMEGDVLHLTNGKGWLFQTEITAADANRCKVRIIESEKEPPPRYRLHLAVAPTKMNDRYEWFLEKATEIGVQEITPVICDHSERKVVKVNRFERVIQSALKQSLHTHFPVLNEPVNFSDFLDTPVQGERYIAHCEDDQKRSLLSKDLQKMSDVTVLIGPEGDFSPAEIKAALKKGWKPVSLGNSRLRTETAAVVACHTVALINEEE
jgi:16S rRNA (uracil1498-N3)-methyltransferase